MVHEKQQHLHLFTKTGTYKIWIRVAHVAHRKLINNVSERQGVGTASRHLLHCFQCSVMKVRIDLNSSNSSHCSVCCPRSQCLSANIRTESRRDNTSQK